MWIILGTAYTKVCLLLDSSWEFEEAGVGREVGVGDSLLVYKGRAGVGYSLLVYILGLKNFILLGHQRWGLWETVNFFFMSKGFFSTI